MEQAPPLWPQQEETTHQIFSLILLIIDSCTHIPISQMFWSKLMVLLQPAILIALITF